MQDNLEIDPVDHEGLVEIELTANLMVAATTTSGRLSDADVDKALGLAGDRTGASDVQPAEA